MIGDVTDAAEAAATLRAAWDELLVALGRARDAIDDPALHAPPPSARVLAEGYRYLLGWVHGAVERAFHADPSRPQFRRAIQPISRSTIDNADALYLNAEIDGTRAYLLRGRAADWRHWRGEVAAPTGRKAPQYAILEAASDYAGDSGSIAELRPGARAGTGTLDSSRLEVEADGRFEILLAPIRPAGHTGNFLATRKERPGKEPGAAPRVAVARHVTLRELFHDWEREDALELELVPLDDPGAPAPLDPARAAAELRHVAAIVERQMRFWNEFYAVVLETHADMNGDGKRFMPRNDFNAPNAATLATGGGQSTNVYAGGVYELADDEALVIESRVPVPPLYQGFHLANLWGESLDYANHQSSLNAHQAERDADGALRLVIAHRDPGVANWVDTTGVPVGFMTFRWTYAAVPAELPTVRVTKTVLAGVRQQLAPETRTVSAAERRAAIAVRRAHVQRRYRQY